MISGEEVLELLPALAAREPTSGYLFYDCQTDDVRLVLTVLGEAERFGAVCANRLDVDRPARARRPRARRAGRATRESGERFEVRAANVVNATGVWADELRPQELHDEAELPRIRPSRGTHVTLRHEDLPLVGGAIVPAGGGRSIFALPWLGHTLVGTTDNDYEGPLDHVEPSAEDIDYLLEAVNAFFGTALGAGDADRRVRRRAPADLDRRPEEVGGHLAQGRAVRDLLGDDHDHRRQAHDLAADGEDDRRPARRARRPRRALPHARDPARPGDRRRRSCRAWRACPRESYAGARRPATATPRTRCSRSPPSAASWPSRSSPGLPDLLAEVALAARREQARSIGDVLLRRTRLGLLAARELTSPGEPARAPAPVERVGDVLARELGWSDERLAHELRALRRGGRAPRGSSPDVEPAPSAARTALRRRPPMP